MKVRKSIATIVEHNSKYLFVLENRKEGQVYNQPAGWLEEGEKPAEGASREVKEETGYDIEIQGLVGEYLWEVSPELTVHRYCFFAKLLGEEPTSEIVDDSVIGFEWLDIEQIIEKQAEFRNPLVLRSIQDYLQQEPEPNEMIRKLR